VSPLDSLTAAGVTVRPDGAALLGLRAGPVSALTAEARALLTSRRDDILTDLLWPPVVLSEEFWRRLGALPSGEEEALW
jgi:hypothetical protein